MKKHFKIVYIYVSAVHVRSQSVYDLLSIFSKVYAVKRLPTGGCFHYYCNSEIIVHSLA